MSRDVVCAGRELGRVAALMVLVAGGSFAHGVQDSQPAADQPQPSTPAPATDSGSGPNQPRTLFSDLNAGTFGSISARLIGPSFMSGRIGDLAVNPQNNSEFYVAASSGGVWKTVNGGHTFSPIFDGYGSYSIGCLTLDPKNTQVLWVGSGENNSQRSVGWGDGVYVSRNGGQSFENLGLKESAHIGRIVVDPRDSNVIFVAAMGPLWKSGGDRGVYRSSNGGKSWTRVLHVSDETGISEVVMDPSDPDTLYATAYQRRRHVWTLINGGPESGVFKSTDGGSNWRRIDSGLPGGEKGRPAVAIAPANPNVVYCIVNATEGGGVFRSQDKGETWQKRSGYMTTSPQYYNELFVDPIEVDRLYSMDTYMQMSEDGGATWKSIEGRDKHVDNHVIWIDPTDTRHILAGCDGGLYETFDRGANWRHFENLPLTQFYRVAIDNALPFFNIYGGTQDNSTIGGPSRTTDVVGIGNENWFIVVGGDGFEPAVDPTDPSIVYGQWQHGGLVRFDRNSGEAVDIKPREKPGDAPYVWHWDSPFMISPHSPSRLYFAGDRLFRSDDRGDSWQPISGDLTRGIDRNQLKVMGIVQKPEAVDKHLSTSIYGNCVALTESPLQPDLLFVGTDDGLLHITEDAGKTWRKVENFPVVPDMTYVSELEASRHSADTLFAGFDNHKNGDFTPYLLRSDDRGTTWRSIAGDLPPNNVVYTIVEDHVEPNLLFVGTEFGAYYTLDGGVKWFKLSGLPTIPVRDMEIHRSQDALVMATFGRGFYVVDDFAPLRMATSELFSKPAAFFPIKPAYSFVSRSRLGYGGRGWAGAAYWAAPNPAYGATFMFHLKDKISTLKEKRLEAQNSPDWKYPTLDQLRAERDEVEPLVFLTIKDADGQVVRRLTAPRGTGVHRVTWDLASMSMQNVGSFGGDGAFPAPPGVYTVTLSTLLDGVTTDIAGPESFEIRSLGLNPRVAKGPSLETRTQFQKRLSQLQRGLGGAMDVSGKLGERVDVARRAASQTPALSTDLLTRIEKLRDGAIASSRSLFGDPEADARSEPSLPGIAQRLGIASEGLTSSTEPPTQTAQEQADIASDLLEKVIAELKVLDAEMEAIETELERAGAPWIPGRPLNGAKPPQTE